MPDRLPKAVLFDWDGTLVNNWPIIHESMNRTLEAMGRTPWTMDETLERVRKSLREAFPPLFGDRWEEARDIFYTAYRAVHLERIEKKDGAEELIGLLEKLGSHLGVVSNKSGGHLRAESTSWAGTGISKAIWWGRPMRRGTNRRPIRFSWHWKGPVLSLTGMSGS